MKTLSSGGARVQLVQAALGVLGLAVVGCSMDTTGDTGDQGEQLAEHESVGVIQEALNACPAGATCFDYSPGSVSARVYQCAWSVGNSNFANHLSAGCFVDSDFALVGGGAEIEGDPAPGGLLTVSMPNGNGWYAESKDHTSVGKHKLRAYAIGLRLAGYTTAQLKAQIHISSAITGSAAAAPTAFAVIPDGELLLGGGARTSTAGTGQLLTASWPFSNAVWGAASKDHTSSSPGFVTAYAISIPACPPGLGYCLTSGNSSWWSSTGTGYRSSTISNPAGWVTVGVGAKSSYTASGRLITDMVPLMGGQGGVFGSTKDHTSPDSGKVLSFAMALRRL
jgi:hypothetical protein